MNRRCKNINLYIPIKPGNSTQNTAPGNSVGGGGNIFKSALHDYCTSSSSRLSAVLLIARLCFPAKNSKCIVECIVSWTMYHEMYCIITTGHHWIICILKRDEIMRTPYHQTIQAFLKCPPGISFPWVWPFCFDFDLQFDLTENSLILLLKIRFRLPQKNIRYS